MKVGITVILTMWGIWAITRTPLDAVPDISDVQVIVSTEWMGRSPDLNSFVIGGELFVDSGSAQI